MPLSLVGFELFCKIKIRRKRKWIRKMIEKRREWLKFITNYVNIVIESCENKCHTKFLKSFIISTSVFQYIFRRGKTRVCSSFFLTWHSFSVCVLLRGLTPEFFIMCSNERSDIKQEVESHFSFVDKFVLFPQTPISLSISLFFCSSASLN